MQNSYFFDIIISFLVWLCLLVTELFARVVLWDFQLIVHIVGLRDTIRDVADLMFFIGGVDRPAQGDMAIHGDDLHVFGVHGHSVGSNDFLANLRRGINVGLAVALVEWRQSPAVTVMHIACGVVRLSSRVGVEVRFNFVGVINATGITGLIKIRPFVGLEVR